jgi:putative transposase
LALARLHRKIRNRRQDFLHKVTTELAKTKRAIVMEDLHVRGMVQNRALARAISDMGFGEFRRMLTYKCAWYGSELIVAPRFYASSKTCSACGYVISELPLSVREWTCPACSTRQDRDINAAKNLLRIGTASSAGSDACGDPSGRAALGCSSWVAEAGSEKWTVVHESQNGLLSRDIIRLY